MFSVMTSVNAARFAVLMTLGLGVAGCNSPSMSSLTQTSKSPLVGSKSGNLRVVAALQPPPSVQSGSSQLIFENDVLEVDVFQVDELDRTVRVDSNGMISMPLIGSVSAAKKSVPDLERELKRRFGAKYLQSPEISVFVKESSGQMVTMDGEFNRPGVFPVSSQATLLRLVAQAGGVSLVADEGKVFVYRKIGSENHVAQYSVEAIRKGKQPDPSLYAGDVVVAFKSKSKVALQNLKEALGVAGSASRLAVPL